MKLPRKRILIRILIYGVAFSYVGYAAIMRCQAQDAADDAAARETLEPRTSQTPTRTVTLPDGTQMPVYELTQEEHDRLFGSRAAPSGGSPATPEPDPSAPIGNKDNASPNAEPSAIPSATPGAASADPAAPTR